MSTVLGAEIEEVERHLDDAGWTARAAAVADAGRLLEHCADEENFARVLGLIERGAADAKWEVRRASATALALASAAPALKILERLEADENRWVREAASRSRRRAEAAGSTRADPVLDQILAVIDKVRPRKLSREDLLQLARVFGDLHYGDLASETAHELNTVVMGVDGYMTALEDRLRQLGGQDAVVAELTGKLRERTSFLTRLVRDLCDYTAAPGDLAPVNVAEIVNVAVDLARGKTVRDSQASALDLQLSLPPDLVVEGARDQLARAFANVIANAMEAVPGEGMVRVTAEATKTKTVVVRVVDTGCGMDAQQLQAAPRRYGTSKRARGGTGLGLPIAIRIVEREHQGRLQIESEAGRGTTVTIELPLTQASKEASSGPT